MASLLADSCARVRTFHDSRYSRAGIAAAGAQRGLSVSLRLPAHECAETVGVNAG